MLSIKDFVQFHNIKTTSTMEDARKYSNSSHYGYVYADEQSAGKGRIAGRKWEAKAKESLLITFWFPLEDFSKKPASMLTGIAVINALKTWAKDNNANFKDELLLKWPNDILCNNKKICGILCEVGNGIVYIGIGLNCLQKSFEQGLRTSPCSIFTETGLEVEANALIPFICKEMCNIITYNDDWQIRYEELLVNRDKPVSFVPGVDEQMVCGTLKGIDETGAVLIDTQSEIKRFVSGEIKSLIDVNKRL